MVYAMKDRDWLPCSRATEKKEFYNIHLAKTFCKFWQSPYNSNSIRLSCKSLINVEASVWRDHEQFGLVTAFPLGHCSNTTDPKPITCVAQIYLDTWQLV